MEEVMVFTIDWALRNKFKLIQTHRYNGFLYHTFEKDLSKDCKNYVLIVLNDSQTEVASLFTYDYLKSINAYITDVSVKKSYRRLGIASKMFDIIFCLIGNKNYQLQCETDTIDGVTYEQRMLFYNKLGFVDNTSEDIKAYKIRIGGCIPMIKEKIEKINIL